MRLLTVRHVTIYRYSEPVGLGEHRMMFRPQESHDLRLIKTRLNIMPKPKHLRWLHDVFDNSVAVATFSGRTSELRFEVLSRLNMWKRRSPTTRSIPTQRPIRSPTRAMTGPTLLAL